MTAEPVRTAALELNADELMYLWAHLKQTDHGTEEQALASVYPLILRLASGLCELCVNAEKKPGTVALTFTEAEMWLLRDRVGIFEKTTDSAFGLKLTLKIATALLSFDAPQFDAADGDAPDLQVTAAQKAAIREQAGEGGQAT